MNMQTVFLLLLCPSSSNPIPVGDAFWIDNNHNKIIDNNGNFLIFNNPDIT